MYFLLNLTDNGPDDDKLVFELIDGTIFGSGFWSRHSDAQRKWKIIGKVALRYLAILPSVTATESSFSCLTRADAPSRQRLDRDSLAA